MKITKILSAVAAAAVATAAVSATASATLTIPTGINAGLSATTGMWMVALYNEGGDSNPAINYGIDLTAIKSISVTVTPSDPEWWDGTFGGGIITSCGPASETPADHNWPSNEYWGVIDEDLGLETLAADKPVQFVKTGDLTYTGTVTLDDSNCIYDVTSLEGGYAQVGIQEWGATMLDMTVTDLTCYDAAGNVIISFDGAGYVDSGDTAAADDSAAADDAATADDNAAATADAEAPATTAPEKGSPDTGVEGIAAVAGVAVVAAGAVVLSKKRK